MKLLIILFAILATLGFAVTQPYVQQRNFYWDRVPVVSADVETESVVTAGDAADDAAIWLNPYDSTKSLILATDKHAGLLTYTLAGEIKQFLPVGQLNNIDLRQNLRLPHWTGDLAAGSNLSTQTIDLFSIDAGDVQPLAAFPSHFPTPYGICTGVYQDTLIIVVTFKTGVIQIHAVSDIRNGQVEQRLIASHHFSSTLEGCVYDDFHNQLYLGEEDVGLWQVALNIHQNPIRLNPKLIGPIGKHGIAEDVEGVTLYERNNQHGYIIASSQGNSSYALFARKTGVFLGRFRIGNNQNYSIDGTQDTDGVAALGHYLTDRFPNGILVVQDGVNKPNGSHQNFKLVDWRSISAALELTL